MYHSKILVSWLSSKSAYPELAYNFFESYKEPFEKMKSAYMKNGKDLEKVLAKKG